MKATLEFDLTDEDQRYRFEQVVAAPKYSSLINQLELHLRELVKYRELTEEQSTIVEEIRTKYYKWKNELGIEE
jgi:hypothetical protein